MSLTASVMQEGLAKAVGIVGRSVSARTTLPVLHNILIEAKGDQLRLAATNLQVGVNCWISAKVGGEWAITLPARLLADFINSLPPERVDIEIDARTQSARLSCGRFVATIKGIDGADFPALPLVDECEGTEVLIDADVWQSLINQTAFAASSDESRPTLTGVEMEVSGGLIKTAATDGFRLGTRSCKVDTDGDDIKVIVPSKSLIGMSKLSAEADRQFLVKLMISQNQMLCQVVGQDKSGIQRMEMASQLIDAKFPDYRGIIPKTHSTKIEINTSALLKSARIAMLFARDNANIIRLVVKPGKDGEFLGELRVTATGAELGDNSSVLDAHVKGDPLEIAFNAKYMIEAMDKIDAVRTVLEFTQPTRPCAMYPVGATREEFLHVIMPMQPKY